MCCSRVVIPQRSGPWIVPAQAPLGCGNMTHSSRPWRLRRAGTCESTYEAIGQCCDSLTHKTGEPQICSPQMPNGPRTTGHKMAIMDHDCNQCYLLPRGPQWIYICLHRPQTITRTRVGCHLICVASAQSSSKGCIRGGEGGGGGGLKGWEGAWLGPPSSYGPRRRRAKKI